jgi:hypothetical protein
MGQFTDFSSTSIAQEGHSFNFMAFLELKRIKIDCGGKLNLKL